MLFCLLFTNKNTQSTFSPLKRRKNIYTEVGNKVNHMQKFPNTINYYIYIDVCRFNVLSSFITNVIYVNFSLYSIIARCSFGH